MYFKPETQTTFLSHSEIRSAHRDVSLPASLTDDALASLGIYPLIPTEPACDPITQAARETTPVLTDKGHWEQQWEVVPRFTEYTDAEGVLHTVAEQEAAAIAAHQAEQAAATLASFDAALTSHLDKTAQARRYDNRITCALRAGYEGPFQSEGQAFATWMDACNWQAYQILSGVQSGALTMPTVDEFIADLPEMVWPT